MPPVDFQWLVYLRPLLRLGWCQLVGVIIFFWGWFHQRRCHVILRNLREEKGNADDYKIPLGDWFKFVSSAHYLAEMVTNLAFAAAETQRWYHRKFDNYPSNRYAVIPLIY